MTRSKTKCIATQVKNNTKQCRNYQVYQGVCKRCFRKWCKQGTLSTIIHPSLSMKTCQSLHTFQQLWKDSHTTHINNRKPSPTLNQGPALHQRSLCTNDTDIYSCKKISSIPDNQFFSFSESDNPPRIYGFQIRSFYYLLKFSSKNPYSQLPLSTQILQTFQTLMKYVDLNTFTILSVDSEVTEQSEQSEQPGLFESIYQKLPRKKKLEQDVIYICSLYDKLGYYMDANVIISLTRLQIIKFYKYTEDIWNYRAQHLTYEQKCRIVPYGKAFTVHYKKLFELSFYQLRKYFLDIMRSFACGSHLVKTTEQDKITGILIILTGLVYVSPQIFEAYPHLLQEE